MTISTLPEKPNNKVFAVDTEGTPVALSTTRKGVLAVRFASGNDGRLLRPLEVHGRNPDTTETLRWVLYSGTTFLNPPTWSGLSAINSDAEYTAGIDFSDIQAFGSLISTGYVGPEQDFRVSIPEGIEVKGTGQQVVMLTLQSLANTPNCLAGIVWRETP